MTSKKKNNLNFTTQFLEEKIKNQNNGMLALLSLDYNKLVKAIDNGFSINYAWENKNGIISYGEPPLQNVAPIIHVANKGWIEGWKLLANKFPNELKYHKPNEFPIFWETALHNAQHTILSSLITLGVDPLFIDINGRNSVHLLFETLRYEKISKPSSDKIIYCLKWLAGKEIDIYSSYPGEYTYDSIYKNGHNFWSYALFQENWEVAFKAMPSRWEDVIKTPRWEESLIYMKKAMKDIKDTNDLDMINKIIAKWEDRFLLESFLHKDKDTFSNEQIIKLIKSNISDIELVFSLWKEFSWYRANQQPLDNLDNYQLLLETQYDYKEDWMTYDIVEDRHIEVLILAFELHEINVKDYKILESIIKPFITMKSAKDKNNSYDGISVSSKIINLLN